MRTFCPLDIEFATRVMDAYREALSIAFVGTSEDRTVITMNDAFITLLDDGRYQVETFAPLLHDNRNNAQARTLADAVGLAISMAIEADIFRCINHKEENDNVH